MLNAEAPCNLRPATRSWSLDFKIEENEMSRNVSRNNAHGREREGHVVMRSISARRTGTTKKKKNAVHSGGHRTGSIQKRGVNATHFGNRMPSNSTNLDL
ncbi:hypothetical protein X777_06567 [Ooceraea biroi]|uniref:Uncharacterized protein n=1 Tax=Ooceraea biroi TaxID=2015173 RepID=A0A026WFR4_OOCBI|nr:hypothetical protein X777_06567 [Ooceraea biroi]